MRKALLPKAIATKQKIEFDRDVFLIGFFFLPHLNVAIPYASQANRWYFHLLDDQSVLVNLIH